MRRGGKIVAKVGGDLSGRALEFRDPAVEQRPTRFQAEAVPIIVEQAQSDLQIDAVEDRLADIDADVRRVGRNDGECLQFQQVVIETVDRRSEEHTSELQSLMRISYAVFCLKKKKKNIIY